MRICFLPVAHLSIFSVCSQNKGSKNLMDGIISYTPGQQSLPCNLIDYTEKDTCDSPLHGTLHHWLMGCTSCTVPKHVCHLKDFNNLYHSMSNFNTTSTNDGKLTYFSCSFFDFVNILRKFPQPTERDHVSNSPTPETPVDTNSWWWLGWRNLMMNISK